MLNIDYSITPEGLKPQLDRMFELAGKKIASIEKSWDPSRGTPVFTVKGTYTTRGWTEWTQGFQFGCALLHFDGTGEQDFLKLGRDRTVTHMAPHLSHVGVHDHGFNNVSTYGNLLRLTNEGRIDENLREREFYELALKMTGAIQAARWTKVVDGLGYIYSFNGSHSLFADTIRTVRALTLSHQLGHLLMGEQDEKINLLTRSLQHAETTARYNVFFGSGRDSYDIRGRVAHEAIFNEKNGTYRCTNTQQGYSPFTTWTRGLAWILSGYPELIEYFETVEEAECAELLPEIFPGKQAILERFVEVSEAVAEFYIEHCTPDGIVFWDSGAPGLAKMDECLNQRSNPFNDFEPVDSSSAAISAQGLLRLGRYLQRHGAEKGGRRYIQSGLSLAATLLEEPYLSFDPNHQGLLLHSVYHRPNGWDYVPEGRSVPCGESCMWGDYHLLELGVYIQRLADSAIYHKYYLD
jgi:unsaturated chondroitin disaccharide hydrolase